MSNEELPENQNFEYECEVHKEILNKYFNGEIPTEASKKSALNMLVNTALFNEPTIDPRFSGMTPAERDEWMAYNSY